MASSTSSSSGLSQLATLNNVKVKQINRTYAIGNKYSVIGPNGEQIFRTKEDSSTFGNVFVGKNRSFHMDILDKQHQEVFTLRRPYTVGPDKMDVMVGGRLVSIVRKEMTFFKPVLLINNAHDATVFKVKGPVNCSGEADFDIFDTNKKPVGCIQKMWSGFAKECFTDKDNFRITFPANIDVNYKAAIIGACFLIDFLYYET